MKKLTVTVKQWKTKGGETRETEEYWNKKCYKKKIIIVHLLICSLPAKYKTTDHFIFLHFLLFDEIYLE